METLVIIPILLAIIVWVMGTADRPAKGRRLEELKAEWKQWVDEFLSSDRNDPDVMDPWLLMYDNILLNQQYQEFLAQYEQDRKRYWARIDDAL